MRFIIIWGIYWRGKKWTSIALYRFVCSYIRGDYIYMYIYRCLYNILYNIVCTIFFFADFYTIISYKMYSEWLPFNDPMKNSDGNEYVEKKKKNMLDTSYFYEDMTLRTNIERNNGENKYPNLGESHKLYNTGDFLNGQRYIKWLNKKRKKDARVRLG